MAVAKMDKLMEISEALSEIESKIPYIKGLIDKAESMTTSF